MVYFDTTLDQLPEPDRDGREHAARVQAYLVEQIHQQGGFLGFDQYMETVLYAPGLGYYSAGSQKFGAGGDYVTAPLISPLFSRTLAGFIGRNLLPGDEVLELGAGTGAMAKDMLAYWSTSAPCPRAYRILEPSADLQQRQRQTLNTVAASVDLDVSWLARLDPREPFTGCIVGNEVIDAMPVRRFVIRSGQVLELGVGLDETTISLKTRQADDGFSGMIQSMLPLPLAEYPDGYCGEYRPALDGWIRALGDYLRSGILVLLDYGFERAEYYRVDRSNGTLRGYYRHYLVEDALVYPGLMDLTASVDFTQLAEAGVRHGFQVSAYTTQANFLVEQGLLEFGQMQLETGQPSAKEHLLAMEAIKLLTDPGEMGESIKVMVLGRDRTLLEGFGKDLRYRL